jgi:hypothetical protein
VEGSILTSKLTFAGNNLRKYWKIGSTGLASQCKNLATLMKMKPKRIPLGRNHLSDAPCRNPGMVLNRQGPGRHPRDASCRDLGTVSSEQGSGRRILSGTPHRCPGVVQNEQGSSHLSRLSEG